MSVENEILNVEAEVVDEYESLSIISNAEVNQQISTAKKYPRNPKRFLVETKSLACETEDIAGECFYRLKRKDKDGKEVIIEGGSSRLAEIVTMAWGNCRCGSRIVEEGERFVTAQGVFHDLERNVAVTYETRRRITTKGGKRFGDDMIGVTCAAAASIALRNAVFKAVPKAYWLPALEAAKQTYRGEASTLSKKRDDWKKYWAKVGVTDDRLLAKLGKPNWESVDLDDCLDMRGYATALKDNSTTLDECFPAPSTTLDGDAGRSKADQLAEQMANKQKVNGNGHDHATETKPEMKVESETVGEPVVKPFIEQPSADAATAPNPKTLDELKSEIEARIKPKSIRMAVVEMSQFEAAVQDEVKAGRQTAETLDALRKHNLYLRSKLSQGK